MGEIVNNDHFDLKSTPTQELLKIQKGVLDALKERLVAKEAVVSSRLDQIIKKMETGSRLQQNYLVLLNDLTCCDRYLSIQAFQSGYDSVCQDESHSLRK